MTKAKLMISLIGLAAALSSILAFNTQKFSGYYIYTGPINTGECTTQANGRALSNGTPAVAASTAPTLFGCQNAYTFAIND